MLQNNRLDNLAMFQDVSPVARPASDFFFSFLFILIKLGGKGYKKLLPDEEWSLWTGSALNHGKLIAK